MTVNGKSVRAMLDIGMEANIISKAATAKLGLNYSPSINHLKTVNAPPTPICGLAHGVDTTLGKWHGKTNIVIAPLDIFDIILMQEFL